jgi:hypothetical protein
MAVKTIKEKKSASNLSEFGAAEKVSKTSSKKKVVADEDDDVLLLIVKFNVAVCVQPAAFREVAV